jgi:alkylhydroperoxidase family enzyme
MAMLFGSSFDAALRYRPALEAGVTEDQIEALSSWATSGLFSDRQRACLEFAEQFILQSRAIDDAHVEALRRRISTEESLWFTTALTRIDGLQRCCIALGIELGETVPREMPDFVLAPPKDESDP